jgi:hypothetical protein
LIVVIGSVIQIGVIVRIIGIPIKRPGKLLRKDPMVSMRETAVLMKCEAGTKCEIPANSRSHPECPAGTMGTEPTTKTAAVQPTAGRSRARRGG